MGFQFNVKEDISISQMVLKRDPSGAIKLHAFVGSDTQKSPVAKILVDMPERIHRRQLARNRKANQELHDVLSFLRLNYSGRVDAKDLSCGMDPNKTPDVIARIEGEDLSVETMQLILPGVTKHENAQSRWCHFERITDWMLERSDQLASRLRAHRGCVVYVGFDEEVRRTLRIRPDHMPKMVTDFLASYVPTPDLIQTSEDGLVRASWMPIRRPPSLTAFEQAFGFRLGVSYDQTLTRADLLSEFQRLVHSHDKKGADMLLVTIGTPTREGWKFPSSEIIAMGIRSEPDPLAGCAPTNVSGVAIFDAVHSTVRWVSGSDQILPSF
ncbi:hypothetical protein [Frankia sp. R82]|uniref:hypothetical protein n=1 Tax=Frankia sp. R82 TaxID=2950553 RepID=UPI00204329DC|nr:hypothetical protein [Frankia sp. R82]MCM3882245.1 hypothetical protein [Frankia sp. R82]